MPSINHRPAFPPSQVPVNIVTQKIAAPKPKTISNSPTNPDDKQRPIIHSTKAFKISDNFIQMHKYPGFKLFQITYTRAHTPGPFAQHILEEGQMASIYPKVLHNFKTRDRTALWISVMGNTAIVKRVVRNHVTRKVRAAFAAALAEKGYGPDGRALEGQKGGNLIGSITFWNLKFIQLLESKDELAEDMAKLVTWLKTKPGSADGGFRGGRVPGKSLGGKKQKDGD